MIALGVPLALPQEGKPQFLEVGKPIEGEITDTDPVVETEILKTNYTDAPVRGKRYCIRVEEDGPYHVDLRSYFFDAYLVLRDESGSVLLEDDDGLLCTHSRLMILALEADITYLLDVCALHGQVGPFEVRLVSGRPKEHSPIERRKLAIEDARESLRRVEAVRGPEHTDVALSLTNLAGLLKTQGAYDEARLLYERILAIREKALGSEHPDVATTLNNLAALLKSQGAYGEARPLFERALAIWEKVLGPEHPNVALILNNLASLLMDQGAYVEARPLFERALAIWEKVLGPEHPRVATSLSNLASLLVKQGIYDEVRPLFERALAIREKAFGPEHPDVALSLNNLAALFGHQGAYTEARKPLERALAIREKVLGPEHPEVAVSLLNLAALFGHQGAYTEACSLYERALGIFEKSLGPEHPYIGASLNGLAGLLKTQGAYCEARPLLERALAINEKSLGPGHPDVAQSLNSLALLYMAQGAYDKACPLLERALGIFEKSLGPEHPDFATSLNNLAMLLWDQGAYQDARPLFERALAIREKSLGPEHPDFARSLNSLAMLQMAQGAYDEARLLFERTMAIQEKALGPEHRDFATSLNNLAVMLNTQGAYDEARLLLERALAIQEKALGPEHRDVAMSLGHLAGLLQDQGAYDEARSLLERALAINEKALGSEHPDVAASLNNLAFLLCNQGTYGEALPLYERALAIIKKIYSPEHPHVASILISMALIEANLGEHQRAWEFAERAMEAATAQTERILWSMSESERLRYARKVRWIFDVFLNLAQLGSSIDGAMAREAYETVLAWKGQVSRSLLEDGLLRMRSLPFEERSLIERLHGVQRRLSDLLYDNKVMDPEQRAEQLKNLREERNRLELELARARAKEEARDNEKARSKEEASKAVAERLPSGSAAVDFLIHIQYVPASLSSKDDGERSGRRSSMHLSAWILRAGKEEIRWIDLGEAALIAEAVRGFFDELVQHRGDVRKKEASVKGKVGITPNNDRLRELLWAPLEEALEGSELIFISPDSFLGTLPFETLQLSDGTYLLEHHAFVYLQDMVSLARMPEKPTAPEPALLAAGGIDYRERGALPEVADDEASLVWLESRGGYRTRWPPLSWTHLEVDAVADLYDQAFGAEARRLVLKGDEATEERMKLEMPDWSHIHLATHGYFQPEGLPSMWKKVQEESEDLEGIMMERGAERRITGLLPGLLSGLVFAGANAEPEPERDNGLLTAEETTYLDLTRCELVVLSACETALGEPESGEGMLGLRRSFRQAGAKTVISSLWRVKDEATSDLMIAFYENLWLKKMGKHEALRAAQRAMLERNLAEHGQGLPSTWGAFVLNGDWR